MNLSVSKFASPDPIINGWGLPTRRADLGRASLIDLLRQIPEFENALLPRSRATITLINRAVGAELLVHPCDETKARSLYANVGLAVDRAALFLSGHDIVTRPIARLSLFGERATRLSNCVRAYRPASRGVFHQRDTIAFFYLLGRLEPVLRGFALLSDLELPALPRRPTHTTVREWLLASMSPAVGEEIVQLLRSLKAIRPSGRVYANPVFGEYGPIAGSDGDWIAGDTLVELKCVSGAFKRQYVTQMICYFALSQLKNQNADLPSFSRLCICLPRQGVSIHGSVDEWLRAFGAPPAHTVVPAIHAYFSN